MKISAILIVALSMALLSDAARSKDPTPPKGTGNPAADNPLGGIQMPFIKQDGRTFNVGQKGFGSEFAAHRNQCTVQHDACVAAVGTKPDIPDAGACDAQQETCNNGAPVYG
ncbi:11790_t:CDS:1 [Paraglomus brasilianum]|uniref:11790_t:CDS:1 n=1 Tax=Paraglomus brasilianum TaxID=144538 RepID=A0A9N9DDM8_9GLOM|nr:11790_t:CDS:1 [Paraglomus brasilianum]